MEMNDYQKSAGKTAIFPSDLSVDGFAVYPALGLVGEAGEFAEKVKKGIRDGNFDKEGAIKELGDVLWYVAACASELDVTLQDVAQRNLNKLASRANRSKIKGSGDDR